jgi:probable rRNA maturation factor
MAHEIVNRQRKFKIDVEEYRGFLDELGESVRETGGLPMTVAFVSDRSMRQMNHFFRGKDSATDVLSFPFEADEFDATSRLGDIAISLETAERQAAENGLSIEAEVKQLMLHGVLHLCGYDHETDSGEMNRYEMRLRRKLGI